MKVLMMTAAVLAVAGPVRAQAITMKPLVDLRTRYETVDQTGIVDTAKALTFRLRTGLQLSTGQWSVLAEGQGTLAAVDHYFDGLHPNATHSLVADPQDIALYRAQLQYHGKTLTLTAGRQRIVLDDERFVGAVNFRDNGQTFDAVRAEITPIKGLKADLTFAWSDRTIWGINGTGARQQSVSGDNIFANLSYVTRLGTLTGFAYAVDQDEALVSNYKLSSQTYGARFAGAYPLSKKVKLSYQVSYATQSAYHRNPNSYRAHYYLIDGALEAYGWKVGGGYEVLGADAGVALTSFQTPVATGFKFQGWVNKFLTTPANGVRDLYGSVGYGWKAIGPAKSVTVQAIYHRFESDRLGQHYGNEIDLLATTKLGKHTALSVRYGDYRADLFQTDTKKVWLQADWIL